MSWKSQGGIYPTEKSNNINVDTVVANNIILKNNDRKIRGRLKSS